MLLLWYRLSVFGYPSCHEDCARHYCIVVYDVGDKLDCSYKMSLS